MEAPQAVKQEEVSQKELKQEEVSQKELVLRRLLVADAARHPQLLLDFLIEACGADGALEVLAGW